MTLDEAIKHCEEIAEEQNKLCERCDRASGYSRSHNEAIRTSDAKNHEKCGQEHIQLAAWLRELKAYKEQEPCNSCCGGDQKEKAKLCQKSYLAGLEHRQEPCADAISRKAMLEYQQYLHGKMPNEENHKLWEFIKELPSVTPKQKTGHWFYDESIENWRCSECKETPKTMGYCGSANFMAEHFKFCNHCGAKMEEMENEE
jgi:hypothetical protein